MHPSTISHNTLIALNQSANCPRQKRRVAEPPSVFVHGRPFLLPPAPLAFCLSAPTPELACSAFKERVPLGLRCHLLKWMQDAAPNAPYHERLASSTDRAKANRLHARRDDDGHAGVLPYYGFRNKNVALPNIISPLHAHPHTEPHRHTHPSSPGLPHPNTTF